jgi:hypothetical protein
MQPEPARRLVQYCHRICSGLQGVSPFTPSVFRGLLTIGDRETGILWKIRDGTGNDDGKERKSSTLATIVESLLKFISFLRAKPELLQGFTSVTDLKRYDEYLQNVHLACVKGRGKQDIERKIAAVGSVPNPDIFGHFLAGTTMSQCDQLLADCARVVNP